MPEESNPQNSSREPNFLIGKGERLCATIRRPLGGAPKKIPYTLESVKQRLEPMLGTTKAAFDDLPSSALPEDRAVAVITLHPQFLAKSFFPARLFAQVGLTSIGSRPAMNTPQEWTKKEAPKLSTTTDLLVSGTRQAFTNWHDQLPGWTDETRGATELHSIEVVRAMGISDRVRKIPQREKEPVLEIVLHASGLSESHFILESFEAYAKGLGLKVDLDRRIHAGGLCFLPMPVAREKIKQLAQFSYLRVIREMPKLRNLDPLRGTTRPAPFLAPVPAESALDSNIKVAIFDGGFSAQSVLAPWVKSYETMGIGKAVPAYLQHGHQVTSAFLFSSLKQGEPTPRPFANVDHYRVLDENSAKDPYELYDVLKRIQNVLTQSKYDLVNLSIGPEYPREDDDVHPWTAFFDRYLSENETLVAIAAGNGGELDHDSGNDRIQVPADSVNALCVGARNSKSAKWKRADYSSIGPGRSPGLVKPDLVGFGGSQEEPFWAFNGNECRANAIQGTSFASPSVLRLAAGVKAHLGREIAPLGIKALLTHCCDDPTQNRIEHGWGAFEENLDALLVCPDGCARVVYQGELDPGEYVRVRIPSPRDGFTGMTSIHATFCYACPVDPEHPGNYTRSGLIVTFRPHRGKGKMAYPKSASFFQLKSFSTEQELRQDAHEWETTLNRKKSMQPESLNDPVFDINYNAREGGAQTATARTMKYALVLSICSPKTVDLYNKIMQRYRVDLQVLRPVIQLPVRL